MEWFFAIFHVFLDPPLFQNIVHWGGPPPQNIAIKRQVGPPPPKVRDMNELTIFVCVPMIDLNWAKKLIAGSPWPRFSVSKPAACLGLACEAGSSAMRGLGWVTRTFLGICDRNGARIDDQKHAETLQTKFGFQRFEKDDCSYPFWKIWKSFTQVCSKEADCLLTKCVSLPSKMDGFRQPDFPTLPCIKQIF